MDDGGLADMIAHLHYPEILARHHLGHYRGQVAARLDELTSAPATQLEATTEALLKACDHLNVTGKDLDEVIRHAEEGEGS